MVLSSEQCAFNSVNSGNMKQRNSLTSNNKQTGRRPADMLDIYKLIYLIWPVWSLQQDWKISNEGPFFRFSWDRQKLLVTLPRWRSLCHSLARDQPQPGSFFQRPREAEKRDPGNEVGERELIGWRHKTHRWSKIQRTLGLRKKQWRTCFYDFWRVISRQKKLRRKRFMVISLSLDLYFTFLGKTVGKKNMKISLK